MILVLVAARPRRTLVLGHHNRLTFAQGWPTIRLRQRPRSNPNLDDGDC